MRFEKKLHFLFICSITAFLLVITPQVTFGQSEEDILNSIGNEMKNESDKKKEAERNDKEYNSLKPKADAAYKSGRYEKAKSYYAQMLKLKPDSDFASGRLTLINQKISAAAEAAAEKKYQSYITQADALLAAEKWTEASEKYKAASAAMPDEVYPKGQLSKINKLKEEAKAAAELAAAQQKYDMAISKADKALATQNWEVAKHQYEQASKLKPNETYPKSQLAKVDKLKLEAEAKATQIALDKKYAFLIDAGDKALSENSWDVAKEKYKLAMNTKPNEVYAKKQYGAVDALKSAYLAKQEQKRIDIAYKKELAVADQLFNTSKWTESIVSYKKAKGLKPSEGYSTTQITKANGKIKLELDEEKRIADMESEFQKQIKVGEEGITSENWEVAINAFSAAKVLKPQDGKVLGLLNQAKAGKKSADELALKKRVEQESQVKLQKQYESKLAEGDQALASKNWTAAESAYTKAKSLKPNESVPTNKLTQLKELKLAEQETIAEEKAQKEEAARVAAVALAADEAKRLEEELAEKERVKEEKRLAEVARQDAELKQKEADRLAKEAEVAEKTKKEEATKLAAIAAAEAKAQRIAEEKLLARQAAEQNERELAEAKKQAELHREQEVQKKKEEKELAQKEEADKATLLAEQRQGFNSSVKKYLESIKVKNWSAASLALNSADQILPDQPELASMREELSDLQNAEEIARAQELEVENKTKALEEEYQMLIKKGDKMLASGDYQMSKTSYSKALKIKPKEEYPVNKLTELKELVLAQNQEELEKQKELDLAYSNLLSQGEQAISTKNWDVATQKFKAASNLKPDKQGPKERLAQVALMETKENDLVAQKLAKEKEYVLRMQEGQAALDSKKYAEAKRFFMGASKIKPKEMSPKEKLAETEKLWAEALEVEKLAEVAKHAEELEENYNSFIATGDVALTSELWDDAIRNYQEAIKLKPSNPNAISKLEEAKAGKAAAVALLAKKRKEEESRLKEIEVERSKQEEEALTLAKKADDFANYMAKGSTYMASNEYGSAVSNFKKAIELKPEDTNAQENLREASDKYKLVEAERLAKEKERKRLAAIELQKRKEIAKKEREAYLAELMKNSPVELAKKYPDGLTEEIKEDEQRVTTKSVIVENGEGRYLVKFEYPWGDQFYYLNGKKITEDTYEWDIRKYKF